jgi:SAM-dependent methyltransferase
MSAAPSIDPVWEEKYRAGHAQRYPWDFVVTFLFRNAPVGRPRRDVRVLEVGCGTASNLWCAAREGFDVCGIDGSPSAIASAKARFAAEGLAGDLRVGPFAPLPFATASADLAIDRGALTCVGFADGRAAIAEIRRVLQPGGRFLFNPYADDHTSCAASEAGADGLRQNIAAGTMVGVGGVCFYGRADVERALEGWSVRSLQHVAAVEWGGAARSIHSEWRAIAEKS